MRYRFTEVFAESGLRGAVRRLSARWLAAAARHLNRRSQRILSRNRLGLASAVLRARLANNAVLKDAGKGRRCFVLASGPSTLDQDLRVLKGESIIAANEMFLRLQKDELAATALIFLDTAYLKPTPGYQKFLRDFAAAAAGMKAVPFLPVEAEAMPAVSGLFLDGAAHYIAYVGQLLDCESDGVQQWLDFTAPLPGLYTSTHAAIALALYMGFAEIHILGLDMDYLANPANPIGHGYGANPYNEYDRISAGAAFRRSVGWSYADLLARSAEELRAFDRLLALAQQRGQRIFNLSPTSIVESFERRTLESLDLGRSDAAR